MKLNKAFSLILLCTFSLHANAQNIFVGLSGGLEMHSESILVTDSFGLLAREDPGTKTITPVIRAGIQLGEKWQVSLTTTYRRNTLSVSAWNPQADTCALCPLIRGGGPTSSEIRLSPEIGWVNTWSEHTIIISGGLTWAIRMCIQPNTALPDFHGKLMRQFASVFNRNPVYLTVAISWIWKRMLGSLRYESTNRYTSHMRLLSDNYPFLMKEDRITLMIGYKVFQF